MPDFWINAQNIMFADWFNENVDHLPSYIKYITFGRAFNKNVDYLKKNVTHIVFGEDFNQSVDHLVHSVTHIVFGYHFNNSVDHLFHSVTNIVFGKTFNRSVDYLPNSVKNIVFGNDFDKSVDYLPNSVKSIVFGGSFNKSADHLVHNVETVKFRSNFILTDYMPKNIKIIFDVSFFERNWIVPQKYYISKYTKKIQFDINAKIHILNNLDLSIKHIKYEHSYGFFCSYVCRDNNENYTFNLHTLTCNYIYYHKPKKIPYGCKN